MLPSDILESGSDDFEGGEDIHDAVGSILTEVAGDEGEDDIIDICNQLMDALKGYVETSNWIESNFCMFSKYYKIDEYVGGMLVSALDLRSSSLVLWKCFERNRIIEVW